MKIELEMRIKNPDEDNDTDNSESTFMSTLTNSDKHEVLFSPESSSLYSSARMEARYDYDYEVNLIRFGNEKGEEYMYIKKTSKILGDKYEKIDPESYLYDTLEYPYSGDDKILNNSGNVKLAKANLFKRLVSKKKRRIQTEYFDLDMAYITERVIGMGFPATGCETCYRNNLMDLKAFLDRYHGEYKIYNLCIEKDRIYPKDFWINKKVGLFPFNDHAPCPIKLILDFCVDICLYLTCNPKGVAAIHCKAGKGRTGVMIVCYLIFSGLCETSEDALAHYARQRTLNNKGVTIASQIRYIKYFETFLSSNFERPFLKCIPKIIKNNLNKGYSNMIMNYNTDMSYFTTINSFKLKTCLIGPFSEEINLTYDFSAITRKKLNFEKSKITRKIIDNKYYYEIEIYSDDVINYDLKLQIKGKKLEFYSWFNLWFSTFQIISQYVLNNNYFDEKKKLGGDINKALSQVEMSNGQIKGGNKKNGNFLSSLIQEQNLKGWARTRLTRAFRKVVEKYTGRKSKRSAIKTLKNNKDLNNILSGIDELATEKRVLLINRDKLEFTIEKNQLDKLKTKIKDDFRVKFTYQLMKS